MDISKLVFQIIGTFAFFINFALAIRISPRAEVDLYTALRTARPGDSIHLHRDTTYYIQAELTRNGLQHAPITLTGDRGTKIRSDGTALLLSASHWRISNIEFRDAETAILVKGSNNTLKSLSFSGIEEAVVLEGPGNLVKGCTFNGGNHGIFIYGKHNSLVKNFISGSTSTVTASSTSCCGVLEGNVFNGLLNLMGGDFDVVKNTANSDVILSGKMNNFKGNVINGRLGVVGCGNFFHGNTAGSSDFTSTCYNWDDGKNNFGYKSPYLKDESN